MMEEMLWAIQAGLEAQPKVSIYEAFIKEFGDIQKATILSEVCVNSTRALQHDPRGHGWFCRTYDGWEIITGIPKTSARDVCVELVQAGLIETEIRPNNGTRATHFRAVPENIIKLTAAPSDSEKKTSFGPCPLCKSEVHEGRKVYYCSNWKSDDPSSCRFVLFKGVLEQFGKETVSHGEIRKLLLKSDIELEGLNSVKNPGTKFKCKGQLEQRDNGKFTIKLVFPEKPAEKKEAVNG